MTAPNYSNAQDYNTGPFASFDTDHAAGVVVIGALLFLILIRRGFRGFGVPGVARVTVAG